MTSLSMEEGAQLILLGQLQKRSVAQRVLQFSCRSSVVCGDPAQTRESVPGASAHLLYPTVE